jgi:hypothetical protein
MTSPTVLWRRIVSGRRYLEIDDSKGYPAGDAIRYECLACGDTLLSLPEHAVACKCRNLILDVEAGRFSVKDATKFRAYVLSEA